MSGIRLSTFAILGSRPLTQVLIQLVPFSVSPAGVAKPPSKLSANSFPGANVKAQGLPVERMKSRTASAVRKE